MPSVFTKIIRGELPARFVWQDERAVAFLTINPVKPGHTLVVTREEIDHWIEFAPTRVGQAIVGIEVPHVHVHLIPIDAIGDLNFAKADPNPKPEALDAAA